MASRPAITVSFVYHLEADPTFWAEPKSVELRAEVALGDLYHDEPIVTPLDKAVWQGALGHEVLFGARSEHWVGADEAAIEAAIEAVSRQATCESNAMAEAS